MRLHPLQSYNLELSFFTHPKNWLQFVTNKNDNVSSYVAINVSTQTHAARSGARRGRGRGEKRVRSRRYPPYYWWCHRVYAATRKRTTTHIYGEHIILSQRLLETPLYPQNKSYNSIYETRVHEKCSIRRVIRHGVLFTAKKSGLTAEALIKYSLNNPSNTRPRTIRYASGSCPI